jgi:hypothetical protein
MDPYEVHRGLSVKRNLISIAGPILSALVVLLLFVGCVSVRPSHSQVSALSKKLENVETGIWTHISYFNNLMAKMELLSSKYQNDPAASEVLGKAVRHVRTIMRLLSQGLESIEAARQGVAQDSLNQNQMKEYSEILDGGEPILEKLSSLETQMAPQLNGEDKDLLGLARILASSDDDEADK